MKRALLSVTAALALIGLIAPSLRAEVTPEQVRAALQNGIRHLQKKQSADGTWPEYNLGPLGPSQVGGVTSLCTLALLHAGMGPEDDSVRRALNWLRSHELDTTYTVSLQTMVFCKAEPDKDRLLIQRNVRWLEKNQIETGPNKGSWAYPGGLNGDNSNTQFAVLALYDAQQAGATVHRRTWGLAQNYWSGCQNPDGSWGYHKEYPGTGSMTCAGIASMIIVADSIRQSDSAGSGDAAVVDGKIQCCQRQPADDGAVQKGLKWLADHFSVMRNPGQVGDNFALYYLYGIERVGRLTAERFIGRHDWYREGADHLVNWHRNSAARPGSDTVLVPDYWVGRGHAEDNDLIATSFALLFLSKGRRPVLMAKAQHRPEDDWNQHRYDVSNLTRYVESRWKQEMTWQVVDLDLADIDDLLQSPVIYYSGSRNPLPRDETQRRELAKKIRGYLNRDGFLLAEADCGGRGFDRGFRELMQLVFPEREYQLRLLDASHPIWRAEQPVNPDHLRPLLGIDFGCRTCVVYSPPDPPEGPRPSLSCLWELSRHGRDTKYPQSVQDQIDAALALGINILAYATNRELKPKEAMPRVTVSLDQDPFAQRDSVSVAKIRHPGGCNVAPRALVNLLEKAKSELKLRVVAEDHLINLTDDALWDQQLIVMHGRSAFRLTETERKRLRQYVERGGLVLADSICASAAFTKSFRAEMAAIFPDKPLVRLAKNDSLLTADFGGYDLAKQKVTRYDPQTSNTKDSLHGVKKKVDPLLEGIKIGSRWGVIFSPYDISCALEKHNSLECQGYIPEDAARIALNVLLYALQQY